MVEYRYIGNKVMFMRTHKNDKKEKIFLDDFPLDNGSNDRFQARQVSQLLKQSIEQSKFPLHISLLGKWGSGKTSVIKLLENELNKEKFELKIVSVWKFADDAPSLHRKIVREIERKLGLENPENLDTSSTLEQSLKANGVISSLTLLKRLGNYKYIIIGNFFLLVVLVLIQFFLSSKFSYVASSAFTLLIVSLVTAFLAKNNFGIVSSIKNVKVNLPLNYGDQYENRFKKVVNQYLGKKNDKKLILVFDDLDRLPSKQLYGALNTIKTFLNSDRCAFIIPCDESVLKEGLKGALDEKAMPCFDVTEYLNKTFDITIRLPKLEPLNMKNFAKTLLEGENIVWYKENSAVINELLAILIHSEVLTPRHVKKNLNAFSTDWELAKKRDNYNTNGKFLTLYPQQLAVFSVLKSDFSELYGLIVEDPYLIRVLAEQTNSEREKTLAKINYSEGLKGFLSKIEDLIPEDPRPFIYFNNEELNPLTGRLDLEELKKNVLNGQKEEFKTNLNNIDINDLKLVFSSVISDISSSIETKKFFSILFNQPELADFIEEKDKVDLTELFKHNLESVLEFKLNNALTVFDKIVNQSVVWIKLGELIKSKESKYAELLESHIEKHQLVDKMQISSIYDIYAEHASDIGDLIDDYYFVPKLIMELPEEHPIVKDVNWYKTLLNCLSPITVKNENNNDDEKTSEINIELKLDFNLSDWLSSVENKTDQIFTVTQINSLLKAYGFLENESLTSIVGFWIKHYKDDNEEDQLSKFIGMAKNLIVEFATKEELEGLGELISKHENNEEVSRTNQNLIDNIYKDFEIKDFIRVSSAFKDTAYIAEFAFNKFTFTKSEINEHLLDIFCYRDDFYAEDSLNDVMNRAQSQIFNQPNVAGGYLLLRLIKQSDIWLSVAKKFNQTWFNIVNDKSLWLKWDVSSESFDDLLSIYYQLNKTESDVWKNLIDSIKDVASININYNNIGYANRHQWKLFVNKGFTFIVNNCDSEKVWLYVFDALRTIQSKYNSNISQPIFSYLEQETISNFITKVPKVVSLNSSELNDLIFKYAKLENTTQLNNVINRWEFFTKSQRIDLSKKIPTDKKELLFTHIEQNPEMKYIDELADYTLEKSIKENIMRAISNKVDTFTINRWIEETLNLFINSKESTWRLSTIKYVVDLRSDIDKPDITLLERLFDFKDERTQLAFQIVLKLFPKGYKHKSEFKEIRKKILLLEEEDKFKELVFDAKEKYGWRNNILA